MPLGGNVRRSEGPPWPLCGPLDPLFDLADARQVLVELAAVGLAELRRQLMGVRCEPKSRMLLR